MEEDSHQTAVAASWYILPRKLTARFYLAVVAWAISRSMRSSSW